ncbi:C39 family peptidase [Paenibacillus jiagnxiensis]|uniref:C39 family peptidase n=1 Tax=Paenibacillus jiagnxiensis TaxID=3228926 RepID=UPI0033B6C3EF
MNIPWSGHNVEASVPIEVYDASNALHSYVINLEIDGDPAGYVEIANNSKNFPVISFSEKSQIINSAEENSLNAKVRAVAKGKKEESSKVVTFGPGRVGLKVDYKDGSANLATSDEVEAITSLDNHSIQKTKDSTNNESKKMWEEIEQIAEDYSTGDIGNDSDGVTDDIKESGYDSVNSYSIYGVGDSNQYYSSLWDGPSGCAPTSAYNVMYYWHYEKGLTRLLRNDSGDGYVDKDDAIALMRDLMNTDDEGNTYISKQDNAMEDFADEKGYKAASALSSDPSWTRVKNDIRIGPSLLSFLGQDYYGDHTVVGVGFKEYSYDGSTVGHRYMKVHDNWGNTPKSVYVAYNRNYDTMYSCYFEI